MPDPIRRKVTANLALTIDGRCNRAGGPTDLSAIVPYAVTELARRQLTALWVEIR